jgi:hypothetical protein
MISIHRTQCLKGWPHHYVTHFQETAPPYRRCDNAHVLRLGTIGLVLTPRWHSRAEDDAQAAEWALGARIIPIGRAGEEAELNYQSLRARER